MSDDIHRKRDFVLSLYSGPRWRAKVQRMPDSQVIAIYMREHNKAATPPPKPTDNKESEDNGLPF